VTGHQYANRRSRNGRLAHNQQRRRQRPPAIIPLRSSIARRNLHDDHPSKAAMLRIFQSRRADWKNLFRLLMIQQSFREQPPCSVSIYQTARSQSKLLDNDNRCESTSAMHEWRAEARHPISGARG
jgi:hypothetical protein